MPTRPGQAFASARSAARSKLPPRSWAIDGVGHALLADERGQRARVDAGDADDAARLQPLVEVPGGAVVRRIGDVGLEDAAAHARGGGHVDGLDVLVVDADIADMGEGEGDDLAGIGGVGQDLLIAGHRRVEADLADGRALGAEAMAFDHRAVGEDEEGGRTRVLPAGHLVFRLCWNHIGPAPFEPAHATRQTLPNPPETRQGGLSRQLWTEKFSPYSSTT